MDFSSPLDRSYGLRSTPTLDNMFGMRVPAPPAPPLPDPRQVIPLRATRQFMQDPRQRFPQAMMPVQRSVERMGIPQNVMQFSPARLPESRMPSGNLTLEQITQLTRKVESTGDYTALNRQKKGNTASGAYQYTDETWNNYGGYPSAMLAPPEVQDRKFAEDIAARYRKHGGDPFRVIAAHYLPAYADNPEMWTQVVDLGKRGKVPPIEQYVRKYIKGTPLEGQFDAYLAKHSN